MNNSLKRKSLKAINEPKTEAGIREIEIDEKTASFLRECIGDKKSGLLFKSDRGNILTTELVNASYSSMLKKYNILEDVYGKVDLHSLRYAYATRCIEAR